MRLRRVKSGQGIFSRLTRFIKILKGHFPKEMGKVRFYRPEFFGRHFKAAVSHALNGPSEWTSGERQLFAAFVSGENRCRY